MIKYRSLTSENGVIREDLTVPKASWMPLLQWDPEPRCAMEVLSCNPCYTLQRPGDKKRQRLNDKE